MDIIEKIELPANIIRLKFGKETLTKKILDQLPWGNFIYGIDEFGNKVYQSDDIEMVDDEGSNIDEIKAYRNYFKNDRISPIKWHTNGELIGFINIGNYDYNERDAAKRILKLDLTFSNISNSSLSLFYLIVFCSNSIAYKGYIDQKTVQILDLKLEQIYI